MYLKGSVNYNGKNFNMNIDRKNAYRIRRVVINIYNCLWSNYENSYTVVKLEFL